MKFHITPKGILVAAIAAFALLLTPLAHAQDGQKVIANISFEFSVNRLHFEAGSYEFNLASDNFGMSVINLKTGKKQYVTVRPQNNSVSSEPGFLVFSRTRETHYLSEVHFSGATGYSRFNTPQKPDNRDRNVVLQGALRK
jgi:hypothetical protein